jgi:hypothetical protein
MQRAIASFGDDELRTADPAEVPFARYVCHALFLPEGLAL